MPYDADKPKPTRASAREKTLSTKGVQYDANLKEAAAAAAKRQKKPAAAKAVVAKIKAATEMIRINKRHPQQNNARIITATTGTITMI